MAIGLFGKLPAKRDFVAHQAPRFVLDRLEPFLQAGIATSRQSLGESWTEAYMQMPIWRFHLGEAICGSPVTGAIAPSIDGVGRAFPLALFAIAPPETAFPTPDADTCDAWFDHVEAVLLDALDPARPFEATLAALAALPEPPVGPRSSTPSPSLRAVPELAFAAAFQAAFQAELGAWRARSCFFWTIGGVGSDASALVTSGMPEPSVMTSMLAKVS